MRPGLLRWTLLVHRDFPYSTFLSQLPQGRVNGDARQPGAKARPFIEIGEVHESAHEGVLHRVFRVLAIAGDPKCHPEDHLLVTFAKHAERSVVTAFRRGYQFGLAPSLYVARRACAALFSLACTHQFDTHRFLLVPSLCMNVALAQAFSFPIHSRIYAGQFSNRTPPASQRARNLTAPRSASRISRRSRTTAGEFFWSSKSPSSSSICAASNRPLRKKTVNPCLADLSIFKVMGHVVRPFYTSAACSNFQI